MLFGKQIAKCKSLFVFNRDPSRIQASKGSALTIKRDSHHHHHHHHPIFIMKMESSDFINNLPRGNRVLVLNQTHFPSNFIRISKNHQEAPSDQKIKQQKSLAIPSAQTQERFVHVTDALAEYLHQSLISVSILLRQCSSKCNKRHH